MGGATRALLLAASLLAFGGTAALAMSPSDNSHLVTPLHYPGAPKPVHDDPQSPYPMNYSEEVAQSLGVRNGHMDVFSSRPAANDPLMPVVSGGLGGDGAMLKLQWRPGS
jgi:hypothetical protein